MSWIIVNSKPYSDILKALTANNIENIETTQLCSLYIHKLN